MDKSTITMTADDDWWLERVTMDGEQRYPERISVGSLDRPRVYVPERTCRNVSDPPTGFLCSKCGWGDFNSPGHPLEHARYCPNCGAMVVDE